MEKYEVMINGSITLKADQMSWEYPQTDGEGSGATDENRLYVNSWGKKPKKMKRNKGSGRKVAALNYENICKMRFLNLLKLEYP